MTNHYRRIERLHSLVCRNLFQVNGTLSYRRTLDALSRLVDAIMAADEPTQERMWYIGESTYDLGSIIVGAFWYTADFHSGQDSDEYRLHSELSELYKPGMTNSCQPESTESDTYNALAEKAGLQSPLTDPDLA